MNVTTCARQPIPALRCFPSRCMASKASSRRRKHKSSPTPSEPAPPTRSGTTLSHTTLPPAKMRALVALYHQAENWVTPETLLERIDATFVPKAQATVETTGPTGTRSVTFEEIDKAKRVIKDAPKMSKWDLTAGGSLTTRYESNAPGSWSNNRAIRERKVIEALYGVVTTPDLKIMPGFEVVKESEGWIKKANEADNQ